LSLGDCFEKSRFHIVLGTFLGLTEKIPLVCKIKSQCHADFSDIFGSKIVQELSEKNAFEFEELLQFFRLF
jgi:hypothetical protein